MELCVFGKYFVHINVESWCSTSSGRSPYISHPVPPTILDLTSSTPNASNKVILPKTGSVSVSIDCTVNGSAISDASFQWTLNGSQVPDSSSSITDNGSHVVGRLSISSVTLAHGGSYRCTVSNNVDSDDQELTLTVVGKDVRMLVCMYVRRSGAIE